MVRVVFQKWKSENGTKYMVCVLSVAGSGVGSQSPSPVIITPATCGEIAALVGPSKERRGGLLILLGSFT